MCSSPMPSWLGRSSVSAPVGHPPPGNCASSRGNPVGTLALATCASSSPRRMSGRARRAENDRDAEPARSIGGGTSALPPLSGGRARGSKRAVADHPDRDPFDRERRRADVDHDRLEVGVLGQELDRRAAAAQPLHRHLVVQARDHDLPGTRLLRLVHSEDVAVEDAGVAHAHAADLQQVVGARAEEVRVDRVAADDVLLGEDRRARGDAADERQPHGLLQPDPARGAVEDLEDAFALERAQMLLGGVGGGEVEHARDLGARRRKTGFRDRVADELQDLRLPRGELLHVAPLGVRRVLRGDRFPRLRGHRPHAGRHRHLAEAREPALDREPAAAVRDGELVDRLARVEGGDESLVLLLRPRLAGVAGRGGAIGLSLLRGGRRLERSHRLVERPHDVGMLVGARRGERLARERVAAVRERLQDAQRLFVVHECLLEVAGSRAGSRPGCIHNQYWTKMQGPAEARSQAVVFARAGDALLAPGAAATSSAAPGEAIALAFPRRSLTREDGARTARIIRAVSSATGAQAVFGRKIKKGYESDAARMIRELLAERPQILAEQKTGRSLWWDRKLDLDQERRTQESRIKQKGYVYQTDL